MLESSCDEVTFYGKVEGLGLHRGYFSWILRNFFEQLYYTTPPCETLPYLWLPPSQQWKHLNQGIIEVVLVNSFYFQLWTDFVYCSGVSIVGFEQVNAGISSGISCNTIFFHPTFFLRSFSDFSSNILQFVKFKDCSNIAL